MLYDTFVEFARFLARVEEFVSQKLELEGEDFFEYVRAVFEELGHPISCWDYRDGRVYISFETSDIDIHISYHSETNSFRLVEWKEFTGYILSNVEVVLKTKDFFLKWVKEGIKVVEKYRSIA